MFELAGQPAAARSGRFDLKSADASDDRGPAVRADQNGPGSSATWQSGLSLTLCEGVPIAPQATLSRRAQFVLKRGIDIVVAMLALIALAPPLLALGLAIRLSSPGPALFRQTREGRNGRPIGVYKFRTMYSDRCDRSGLTQTTSDDPRVTPIGRWLRRTSIDELPQLLNVLGGSMSLVGPRPHAFGTMAAGKPYDQIAPHYGARHAMKPGISGWAQANGYRGPTDEIDRARARIDHDLAYIENFSLLLDFRIIWMTLLREFLNGTGH